MFPWPSEKLTWLGHIFVVVGGNWCIFIVQLRSRGWETILRLGWAPLGAIYLSIFAKVQVLCYFLRDSHYSPAKNWPPSPGLIQTKRSELCSCFIHGSTFLLLLVERKKKAGLGVNCWFVNHVGVCIALHEFFYLNPTLLGSPYILSSSQFLSWLGETY